MGRSEEAGKIHWDKVCLDRENGGLGVLKVDGWEVVAEDACKEGGFVVQGVNCEVWGWTVVLF
jgi:hypothetical protein